MSFERIDADSDGQTTLEEFSSFPRRKAAPEDVFKRLDNDDDGYITREEFEKRRQGKIQGKCKR